MATRMSNKAMSDLLDQTRRACDDKDITIAMHVETIARQAKQLSDKEAHLRITQVKCKQARAAVATDKPISEARARMNAAREEAMRTGVTTTVPRGNQ